MKLKLYTTLPFIFITICFIKSVSGQTSPCNPVSVKPNPITPLYWSPDSTRYLLNLQDSAGVFQIYIGTPGDTALTDISYNYSNGNCCGLFRPWYERNKLQVRWDKTGQFIICGVEKEYYNELLYTPYSLLLGWLQSGLWLDIWAVTPDGQNWYQLYTTQSGFTGPAFTPAGNVCAWAEALDSSNLSVDVFGIWKLRLANYSDSAGTPSFSNITDITPAGARWIEPGNFAPDGQRLLISSDIGMSDAQGQDQFILNVTNGNLINLTNSPMIWDEHGVFSPDGSKVLFMSSYPYRADTNSYHTATLKTEFMIMNADTPAYSALVQLTHYCDSGYIESDSGIAATGFWGHDDSTIFGQSLILPNYDNWIIKLTGNCGENSISTSVNEPALTNNTFLVYPNPAGETLSITIPGTSAQQIQIYNAMGMLQQHFELTNSAQVNISDLPAGLYFVHFVNSPGLTQKIIKE